MDDRVEDECARVAGDRRADAENLPGRVDGRCPGPTVAAAAVRVFGTNKAFRESVVAEVAHEPVVVVDEHFREVGSPMRGKRREGVVKEIELEVAAGISLADSAVEVRAERRFEIGEDAVAGHAGADPEAKREDVGVERGGAGS